VTSPRAPRCGILSDEDEAAEIVARFADRLGMWQGYPLIDAIALALAARDTTTAGLRAEVERLRAEVERLRALEADAERARVQAEMWSYYKAFVWANGAGSITELVVQRDEARAAVEAERAAVVAWLRARSICIGEDHRNTTDGPVCWAEVVLLGAANAIERGEHRAPKPPENDPPKTPSGA
jgi:hypothetical protein